MEPNSNKSIQEYTLVNSKKIHSAKGQKGFVKKQPEDIQNVYFNFAVTKATKEFVQEYCKLNGITMTDLFLGSLECYTGFNGKNQEDILNPLKEYIEMEKAGY
jgi:hypothetical protein